MQRLLPLAALLPIMIAAGSASATAAPLYRAGLATPATVKMVLKDVSWTCVGAACAAPRTASSSDGKVCAAMVRKVGPVTSFNSGERAFDDAELARCNSAAE